MSYRRALAQIPLRPVILLAVFVLVLAVLVLSGNHPAVADPLPRDPVAELRQALLQEKDSVRDKDALRYRRDTLTRKAQALTSLGDMSRALLLQEWRADGIGEAVADIDREIRDGIADRFVNGLKEALASNDPARREAAAELISETSKNSRRPGFNGSFLRPRLASLVPDVVRLSTDPDPRQQQFAAEALGNIGGEPKQVVPALGNLIKTAGPFVQRAAADALGNVIQVVSQQERHVQGGAVGRGVESRRDLIGTGEYVVPAAVVGLAAAQQVEVRRLCADALQLLSTSLVDLTLDPYGPERYPPPGRPWTAEEARGIETDRNAVRKEREELRPLLEAFRRETDNLATASEDLDPYVRIQVRRVFEDLAIIDSRLTRREASIPHGEGVPPPRRETTPPGDNKKEPPPNPGGVYLPPALPATKVPVHLVADEKAKAGAGKSDAAIVGKDLRTALPTVVAGLRDPNVRARLGAVEILENMGPDAVPAIPALVQSMQDPDRFVRWVAVRTLGRLAPRSAELVVPAAARLLSDGDLDVEVAAATALERFGAAATDAVPALAIRASQGDADIRIAAMRALVAIGTDATPALPSVTLNLIPKSRAEREQEPGPEYGPLPAPRVRVAACETLGAFGKLSNQAVPVLQQALNDSDFDVRRAASEAILKITGKQ
jgi:HEAT repeat protein